MEAGTRTLRTFMQELRTPQGRTTYLTRPYFAAGLNLLIALTCIALMPLPDTRQNILMVAPFPFIGFFAFLCVEYRAYVNFGKPSSVGRILFQFNVFPFGGKLRRLQANLNREGTPDVEAKGLFVKDILQRPAVIQIRDGQISFVPVIGEAVTLSFEDISDVKESAWFNGSYAPGQTAFMFKATPANWRIGFAIYDDPEPWRRFLERRD
jgi:hypothetical protein